MLKKIIKELMPPILIKIAKKILELLNSIINNQTKKGNIEMNPMGEKDKQKLVKDIALKYKFRVFFETGTYLGDMINAVKNIFDEIHSIEVSDSLYGRILDWFPDEKHINFYHGDSGKLLPKIIKSINSPCLFWLDAHFSGGLTDKADYDTPIIKELLAILKREYKDYILIDDARKFVNQEKDYPSVEKLKTIILSKNPNVKFEVLDDVIRIYK